MLMVEVKDSFSTTEVGAVDDGRCDICFRKLKWFETGGMPRANFVEVSMVVIL